MTLHGYMWSVKSDLGSNPGFNLLFHPNPGKSHTLWELHFSISAMAVMTTPGTQTQVQDYMRTKCEAPASGQHRTW